MRRIGKKSFIFTIAATTIFSSEPSSPPAPPRLPSEIFLTSPNWTFDTYFNALIMQPTSSNLQYASEILGDTVEPRSWNTYEIHTKYRFGFDVGIGGVFRETNSGLNINWEHFHSKDHDSENDSTYPSGYNPFFESATYTNNYQFVSGKNSFFFDEINLNYATFVSLGNLLQLNLFSGVSFTRIKQSLHSFFSTPDGVHYIDIKTPSTFMGAGPQFGFSFSQKIVQGFKFNGKLAGTLLVGPQRNHTQYSEVPTTIVTSIQHITPEGKVQLVPGFEGNLGLAYIYTFLNHYMINLEAGYKAQVYLNPIQSTDTNTSSGAAGYISFSPLPPETLASSLKNTISNFGLAGPYVMLSMGF